MISLASIAFPYSITVSTDSARHVIIELSWRAPGQCGVAPSTALEEEIVDWNVERAVLGWAGQRLGLRAMVSTRSSDVSEYRR